MFWIPPFSYTLKEIKSLKGTSNICKQNFCIIINLRGIHGEEYTNRALLTDCIKHLNFESEGDSSKLRGETHLRRLVFLHVIGRKYFIYSVKRQVLERKQENANKLTKLHNFGIRRIYNGINVSSLSSSFIKLVTSSNHSLFTSGLIFQKR